MAQEAFDLAEQFQTPVFVMMDLDLGMNNWMSDGFKYPDKPINRGKLLTAEMLKKLGEWGRYKDVDGDGIAVPHDSRRRHAGVLHARIRPQRQGAVQRAARRLRREHGPAGAQVRDRAQVRAEAGGRARSPDAKIGFIGYGTSHWAIGESRDQLREETDVKTSYFRLRAYPFTDELAAFIDAHERVYVIEQNRDAQLLQLMKLELTPERHDEAAQRAALQRPADRRPQHHRRCAGAGRLRSGEEERSARPARRPA